MFIIVILKVIRSEKIFSRGHFFQETNKQIRLYVTTMVPQVDLFYVVRFLKEIEDTIKTSDL